MPNDTHKNLSDSRGNPLGIAFFKISMALFGLRFCCIFVWFVAAFYALFDRRAFHAAEPYLKSRFNHAGRLKLTWHFYRMIVTHGQAIVVAYWLRSGHSMTFRDINPQFREQMLQSKDSGFIMLMSHVGCWQATIPRMEAFDQDVFLLIQNNLNGAFTRLLEGKRFHVISNQSPFGGLLDCTEALQNRHVLCLMGDRLPDNVPTTLTLNLHGRTVRIPEAPWHLAARCKVPIFPVFTVMNLSEGVINFIYEPPITIDYNLPRRPHPEHFRPALLYYENALEHIIEQHPYQIFHYEV